ncbi:F-box protein 27 [Microdochium nivale]|nr:F-box protein 27 [Microdochium nivale]
MSALDKVIATPELLEAVLLHLDLRTLLVHAQLVSRHFRHLIASSVSLQRALFFLADGDGGGGTTTTTTATTVTPGRCCSHSSRRPAVIRLNPLLREPFCLWFPAADEPNREERQPKNSPDDDQDLPPSPSSSSSAATAAAAAHHGITQFHRLRIWADRRVRAAVMRPEASWRRMLVQQPAPTRLGWLSWGLDFSPAEVAVVPIVMRGCVPFSSGLTMGALYDLTQNRLEGFPRDHLSYCFRVVRAPQSQPQPTPMLSVLGAGNNNNNNNNNNNGDDDEDTRWHRDEQAHAAMREMQVGVLFEERGYYPTRVQGRSLDDMARSDEYRHPCHQKIDVRLERRRPVLAVE